MHSKDIFARVNQLMLIILKLLVKLIKQFMRLIVMLLVLNN